MAEDIDSTLSDPVGHPQDQIEATVAVAALRAHVESAGIRDAQSRLVRRLRIAHPGVATRAVPEMATDVHDLAGLREIGDSLRS